MDRRIFLNERVHTMQITQAAHDLAFYGLTAIGTYRERVNAYNPATQPLPEELYLRLALGKQALPEDFRQEWRRADTDLVELLMDVRALRHPDRVWMGLLKRFQHATELPRRDQALGFLNLSEARLKHLVALRDHPSTTSLTWSSRIYDENTMLRGAFMGNVFLIPADRPNLN